MIMESLTNTVYAATEALPGAAPATGSGALHMMLQAGPMVKFVLLVLLLLSVSSWCVIFMKFRATRKAKKESQSFITFFRQRKSYAALYKESQLLQDSHLGEVFRQGYMELNRLSRFAESKGLQGLKSNRDVIVENVDKAMQKGIRAERQRFERFLPLLATTASTAPFIGLFGTVWGIMTSFQAIGIMGAANLAVVAPGISEALVATAIGLGVAIPAVIAYNHFSNAIRIMENEMIYFAEDFLDIIKRDLVKKAKSEGAPSEPVRLAAEM